MLTPSESRDLQRGYFQLDQISEMYDQSGCWDLSNLFALPIQYVPYLELNSKGTDALSEPQKVIKVWRDPYWDAYKFDEPHTIPRCWDVSSLY